MKNGAAWANDSRSGEDHVARAAERIRQAGRVVAFTGAGISVESGIPPFRGETGVWRQVDPSFIEIGRFRGDPAGCWPSIRKVFYGPFGQARPNAAHLALARLEREGHLLAVITQNIDHLHQDAGSKDVVEFHGQAGRLRCLDCDQTVPADPGLLLETVPRCFCGGLRKPDFVFFGEPIPDAAAKRAFDLAERAEVMLVIGSSGEVMPAGQIPLVAARHGAYIIEINPEPSVFTRQVTDLFLQGPAGRVMAALAGKAAMRSRPPSEGATG